MQQVMIMVAPNGARKTTADHPALPVTADQLAHEAFLCARVGASAIHVHVRDDKQGHVLDAARYKQAIAAVDAATDGRLAVQITTEAVGVFTPQQQMACVRGVMPRAVSVALREIVPVAAGARGEAAAQAFFVWMKEQRISPQFILYDAQDVHRFFDLQAKGVVPFEMPFLLFVLGRYAKDQQSAPGDLDPFIAGLDGRSANWAMCAFGRREAACAVYAASLGGHVRIGFENNLYLPDGRIADSNSALVEATAQMLTAGGFTLMDGAGTARLLKQSLQ